MLDTLDLSVQILTATGWLELEDPLNGYQVHKEAFATVIHTWRKQEIPGDWMEGTYLGRAVRDNVVETLSVYVVGATQAGFQAKLKVLVDALEQLGYQIRRTIGDSTVTWDCLLADISIETTQELIFATRGIVKARVPRLPAVT